MTRLRHWVLFEVIAGIISCCGILGCTVASRLIFTNMPIHNFLLLLIQGAFGVLVMALGVGFVFGLIFILLMVVEINPEVSEEERELKRLNK